MQAIRIMFCSRDPRIILGVAYGQATFKGWYLRNDLLHKT
jgi:hypothetical protein